MTAHKHAADHSHHSSHCAHEGHHHQAEAPTTLAWAHVQKGQNFPDYAIVAEKDESGNNIYIGKTEKHGQVVIGKASSKSGCLTIFSDGQDVIVQDFFVLVGPEHHVIWRPSEGANIPHSFKCFSIEHNGDTVYIGRATYENVVYIGKVEKQDSGIIRFLHNNTAVEYPNFELLCFK